MREAPLRIRIMGVRRTASAAALAALVAVPFGLLALGDGDSKPRDVVVRGPMPANTSVPRPRPAKRPSPAPTPYELNGPIAERTRTLPDSELAQLVRRGDGLSRLAALHVLWTRGRRSEVEALVAESGSRVLSAKLEALRARTR